jgi:hypothetical protein
MVFTARDPARRRRGVRCGCTYTRGVNPAVFFTVAGGVLIVWGSIVAIYNKWAARWMKRMQSIYGQRAADRITPGYVRLIGICLAAGGVLFIVLTLTGVLPNHDVPFNR